MPTLRLLIGNKVVDAELVVHEDSLVPRVPDEQLTAAMPRMTARLEAKGEVADLLFEVGDLVSAAKERFPEFYGEPGSECAKALAEEYQRCREQYGAGDFGGAREKTSSLKGQVRSNMVSLELRGMVEKELKKKTKTKKVKVSTEDGEKVFQMAARFDISRLRAKLLGTKRKQPVGKLVELPKDIPTDQPVGELSADLAAMDTRMSSSCSCDCTPPSIDESGSVGNLLIIRRLRGGQLMCEERFFEGDSTGNFQTTSCSKDEGGGWVCAKIRHVFFPES